MDEDNEVEEDFGAVEDDINAVVLSVAELLVGVVEGMMEGDLYFTGRLN